MKNWKSFALLLLAALAFSSGAPRARAASAVVSISTNLTFDLVAVSYDKISGNKTATFALSDPSGVLKKYKTYLIRTDGSGIYDTDNGSQLAASSTTLSGNLDTFKANADSGMATAAGAGKVVF